eukprot:6264284-Amphidinium_carterae.6
MAPARCIPTVQHSLPIAFVPEVFDNTRRRSFSSSGVPAHAQTTNLSEDFKTFCSLVRFAIRQGYCSGGMSRLLFCSNCKAHPCPFLVDWAHTNVLLQHYCDTASAGRGHPSWHSRQMVTLHAHAVGTSSLWGKPQI